MVAVAEVAAPGVIRALRLPPFAQLAVGFSRAKIGAVLEQVQVNGQAAGMERVLGASALAGIELGRFGRTVGLAQGYAIAQLGGVQDEVSHAAGEFNLQLGCHLLSRPVLGRPLDTVYLIT